MNIAFLGLGAIGRPMAARIAAAGFPLAVWNRTAQRAADLSKESGARHAKTPADAARDADVVITCLPVSPDVLALVDGPDGLLAGMKRGSTLVDCTSGDPAKSRRIAERLAPAGVDFLDAPVSGGVSGAEKGALTVMVGGDAAVLDRVRPVLELLERRRGRLAEHELDRAIRPRLADVVGPSLDQPPRQPRKPVAQKATERFEIGSGFVLRRGFRRHSLTCIPHAEQ